MNIVIVMCLVCIIFEIYHFFFHNYMFVKCNPFYSRMRVIRHYRRMYESCTFLRHKNFSKAQNENVAIQEWLNQRNFVFDTMYTCISNLPAPYEMERDLLLSLSPGVIGAVAISCIMETLYFSAFAVLAVLLPADLSQYMIVVIFILSGLHVLNEYDKKMRTWWYPLLDSALCIATYASIIVKLV